MEETETKVTEVQSSTLVSSKASTKTIFTVGVIVVLFAVVSAIVAFMVISTRESNTVKVPNGFELFETDKFGFAYPENYTVEQAGSEERAFFVVQPEEFNDDVQEGVANIIEYTDLNDEQKQMIEDGECEELGDSIFRVDSVDDSVKLVINYSDVENYSAGDSFVCQFLANAELLGFNIFEQTYYFYNQEKNVVVNAAVSYRQDETPQNLEELMEIIETLKVY